MDGLAFVHVGAAALAGFFASAIECVESLSVVLAIALVRGWQGALAGSVSGILLLAVAARVLVCRGAFRPPARRRRGRFG